MSNLTALELTQRATPSTGEIPVTADGVVMSDDRNKSSNPKCCFRDCDELPVANVEWGPICETHSYRLGHETTAPQWQPIGNEPRDTTILCYWPALSEYGVPATCTAVHSSVGDGWHRPHSTFSELRTPTHWMSIPASPVKSDCNQAAGLITRTNTPEVPADAPNIRGANPEPSAPAVVRPTLSEPPSLGSAAGVDLTVSKPAQHIPGALRCEKHGVTFAFDGDTCWACQEESNAPINS